MTSKLRQQAANFINEAGLYLRSGADIECVRGHDAQLDSQRWEIMAGGFQWGCWLTLTNFVRECKKHGGAKLDRKEKEIWPAYPEKPAELEPPLPDYQF